MPPTGNEMNSVYHNYYVMADYSVYKTAVGFYKVKLARSVQYFIGYCRA